LWKNERDIQVRKCKEIYAWHSSILDVRFFRAADRDINRYLMVAKVRERLAVSKQTKHRFRIQRSNLKNFKEIESKE
jgi:hypothetical protein